MRLAKLSFALLGFAAALMAADPFVGTWKLNPDKSKFKTGAPLKDQVVTIAEAGTDLDVMLGGTSAEGKPISVHYSVPAQGGEGKIIQAPYDAVSGKRMGKNRREISFSKGGKVVLTASSRVSGDGKTTTVIVKGTDAQGKDVDAVAVYDKL